MAGKGIRQVREESRGGEGNRGVEFAERAFWGDAGRWPAEGGAVLAASYRSHACAVRLHPVYASATHGYRPLPAAAPRSSPITHHPSHSRDWPGDRRDVAPPRKDECGDARAPVGTLVHCRHPDKTLREIRARAVPPWRRRPCLTSNGMRKSPNPACPCSAAPVPSRRRCPFAAPLQRTIFAAHGADTARGVKVSAGGAQGQRMSTKPRGSGILAARRLNLARTLPRTNQTSPVHDDGVG